jgi:hypothetical protein
LLLLLVSPLLAAEPQPHLSTLARIDLKLTLDQYKQARSEQFKSELQLKLFQNDPAQPDGEKHKLGRQRLEERARTLQNMADELREKVAHTERELAESTKTRKTASKPGPAIATASKEGPAQRMLGTGQLVRFADGRVSESNVGELKFIGHRHWSVSRVNPRTGRLDYHMGGTYTLNGNEYTETIEYGTGGPIGETFTYKLSVKDDQFIQLAEGNPWSLLFKRAK